MKYSDKKGGTLGKGGGKCLRSLGKKGFFSYSKREKKGDFH